MLAATFALVIAHACPEGTTVALESVDARVATLRAEASLVKNPRERERLTEAVAGLDDTLLSLRAEIGCRAPSSGGEPAPTSTRRATPRPEILDAPGTRALLAVLKGERFDDVRLSALESGLVGRCVDANSARQLLDVFRADAPRLDAWRRIAPRLTDRSTARALIDRLGAEKTRAAGRVALDVPAIEGCSAANMSETHSDPGRDQISDPPR